MISIKNYFMRFVTRNSTFRQADFGKIFKLSRFLGICKSTLTGRIRWQYLYNKTDTAAVYKGDDSNIFCA